MRPILFVQALLILLAATDFTIVTATLGQDTWRWCYFRYASQNGFGYQYVSEYTLPVVLTYVAAFAAGTLGFSLAIRQGRSVVGALGLMLSLVGLISFGIEGSHWLVDHNRSWLAFSPAAMLVLALLACRPLRRRVVDRTALNPHRA